MTRTQLYEMAMTAAKTSLAETDPIKLALIPGNAAENNSIASEDFQTFQQDYNMQRANYRAMSKQLLPSQQAAAKPAQQNKPAAKVVAAPAAPASAAPKPATPATPASPTPTPTPASK